MSFRSKPSKRTFTKISINKYVILHKKSNPGTDVAVLKKSLAHFRKLKSEGQTCDCGNPIWIIGSAIAGMACFTCITGESAPCDDYEIK